MASISVHGFQLRDAILHNTDLTLQVNPGAEAQVTAPYGEMYIADNAVSLTLTLQNTFYLLTTSWVAGLTNSFTASTGTSQLIGNQAGIYEISCLLNYSGPNNQTFEFCVALNGVVQQKIAAYTVPRGPGAIIATTVVGILQLAANDALTIMVQCTTAVGAVITVTHANFTARSL